MVVTAVHRDTLRDEAAFEQCLHTVSPWRQRVVHSLAKREDQQRSLCAALALDACLRTVGLRERTEPVERDAHGKPSLSAHPEWNFSVSHSGLWSVCALAETPVGVDVEKIRPMRVLEIAKRYFTEKETTLLSALDEPERTTAFFRLWTAKESVLKAKGTGLSGGLSSVPIGYGDVLQAPAPWLLREYSLPDHCFTVCGVEEFPREICIISSCDTALLR